MSATKIVLAMAFVGLCTFIPRSVIADDAAIQELTKRITFQGLLGAPGRVELTYGHLGHLPESLKVPDDTEVVGTVAELPSGHDIYGGSHNDDYTVYFKTTRSPQSIYTALADQLLLAGYQAIPYSPNAPEGFKPVPQIGETYCRHDSDPTIYLDASSDGNDRRITNATLREVVPRPGLTGGTTCTNRTNASGVIPPALPEIASTDAVVIMARSIPPQGMGTRRQDAGLKTALAVGDVLGALTAQVVAAGWKRDDSTATARVGIATFSMRTTGRAAVAQLMISRLTPNTMFAQLQTMWLDAPGYAPN